MLLGTVNNFSSRLAANERMKAESNFLLYHSCEYLAEQFALLKSPQDIAKLLSVKYSSFVYHLYKTSPSLRYSSFEVPKKNSDEKRIIFAPNNSLKIIQRKLSQVLYSVYRTKPSVHGFAPTKSILTNARVHAGKRYVLNVDLKGFFPSINFGRVRGLFMKEPYNLNARVATILAQICCHEDQLPQGAPTSPIVSNMICARMDTRLQRLAKEFRCTYTRYADDITFSTTLPRFPEKLASIVMEEGVTRTVLGEALISAIVENGFEVNERKVYLQHEKSHQEVTGLTVNEFPNVDRCYVRQIRAMLHNWRKHGLEAVQKQYEDEFASKPREPKKEVPTFKQVLRGKIDFLGMVKGKDNSLYKKFLNLYHELSKRDASSQ